jgi:hypothetical protein
MRPSDQVSGDIAGTAEPSPRLPDRPISSTSLRVHAQGLLASFEAGRAGFVPDRYLATFGDDAASAALELCAAGVWAQADGGYRVVSTEALRMAHEVHRQMQESRDESRKQGR